MKKSERHKRESFRVVALISAYNEGDVIGAVIEHLVQNGIDVYFLDNHSTDDTFAEASRWLDRGVIGIETFPSKDDQRYESAAHSYDWTAILRRKEELARELDADWFLHHDADEIRESPWDGVNLKDAIRFVDSLDYNCIDFRVVEFPPIDDGFRPQGNLKTYFTHYREAHGNDQLQLKCWKARRGPISIVHYGGHEVEFEGKRVFPIQFLLRHYPIRGQAHGLKKVFQERKPRFRADERAKSWHVQYDDITDEAHSFLTDPETLRPFDLSQARLELWLHNRVALAEKKATEAASTHLTTMVTELRQQMKSADEQFALKAKAYENHIGALEGRAGTLEDQIQAQKVEYQTRLAQLAEGDGREQAIQSLREELSAEAARRSQAEHALARARQEADERLARLTEAEVNLRRALEDLDGYRREKAALEERLSGLRVSFDETAAAHARLDTELTDLREQFVTCNTRKAEIGATNARLDTELADMGERFIACSMEKAEVEARLACTQNELTNVYASKTWRWGSPIARLALRLGLIRSSGS